MVLDRKVGSSMNNVLREAAKKVGIKNCTTLFWKLNEKTGAGETIDEQLKGQAKNTDTRSGRTCGKCGRRRQLTCCGKTVLGTKFYAYGAKQQHVSKEQLTQLETDLRNLEAASMNKAEYSSNTARRKVTIQRPSQMVSKVETPKKGGGTDPLRNHEIWTRS